VPIPGGGHGKATAEHLNWNYGTPSCFRRHFPPGIECSISFRREHGNTGSIRWQKSTPMQLPWQGQVTKINAAARRI